MFGCGDDDVGLADWLVEVCGVRRYWMGWDEDGILERQASY